MVRAVSRGRLVLRRFLRRRLSVAGLAMLVLLFGLAFLFPAGSWGEGSCFPEGLK
jgi:glutathione transport system permease protein